MSKHTKTPWQRDPNACGRIIGKNIADGVADAYTEANTAFIVRACNAHDELIKQASKASALLGTISIVGGIHEKKEWDLLADILDGLYEALAKAKGEA